MRLPTLELGTFVIPKRDAEDLGVIGRRSVPTAQIGDRSNTIAFGLPYGPIGARVGTSMDSRAREQAGGKPVIGVACQVGEAQHAFFLEFALPALYRRAHEFLDAGLPGLLRR